MATRTFGLATSTRSIPYWLPCMEGRRFRHYVACSPAPVLWTHILHEVSNAMQCYCSLLIMDHDARLEKLMYLYMYKLSDARASIV